MSSTIDKSLLTALRMHGVAVHPGHGAEVTICCPYCVENGHSPDFEFKLGINLRSNKAHCFRCEFKTRRAIQLLVRKLELGMLAPGGLDLDEPEKKIEKIALPNDYELLLKSRKTDSLHKQAYEYLKQRGIDDAAMEEHDVGISLCGKYAYRIIFPVYVGGDLQGIVARDFTGTQDKLKYLNSIGDKAIYNLPTVKQDYAVMVEGVFDALRVEIGLRHVQRRKRPDCLGLLGHALTEDQERLLKGYRKLVLWPDGDLPGCKGFGKLGDRLHSFFKVEYIMPEAIGTDPGDLRNEVIANKFTNRARWMPSSATRLEAWAAFFDA